MKLEMMVIINCKIMENMHQRLLKLQFIHQDNKKERAQTAQRHRESEQLKHEADMGKLQFLSWPLEALVYIWSLLAPKVFHLHQ